MTTQTTDYSELKLLAEDALSAYYSAVLKSDWANAYAQANDLAIYAVELGAVIKDRAMAQIAREYSPPVGM